MKNIKYKYQNFRFVALVLMLLVSSIMPAKATYSPEASDYILVITSYNPDTRRISTFINRFVKSLNDIDGQYSIRVNDMAFRGLENVHDWKQLMREVLEKNNSEHLKAVMLLGQEAWMSFLMQDDQIINVPFFVCFASQNGLMLPESTLSDTNWYENVVDTPTLSLTLGNGGGYLNNYDVQANIKLIRLIYPDTENIALLTDNSYGGVALNAYVKQEMAKFFPQLNLISLDARRLSTEMIVEQINQLPRNTVLLLGTWRIDNTGSFFLDNTLGDLTAGNPKVPIFSLTSLGNESIAIGGFQPDYQFDPSIIATQIQDYYSGNHNSVAFSLSENKYIFDKNKLKEYDISEYTLPEKSQIITPLEMRLNQMQFMVMVVIVVCCLLLIAIAALLYIRMRLLKQRKELLVQKENALKSERMKTAFITNMSHQIRTPLNAIVGFSELLISDNNEDKRSDYVKQIKYNNSLLINMIGNILDLSELESGKIDLNETSFDLNQLFNDIYQSYIIELAGGVTMSCMLPCSHCTIRFDRKRLSQIITNFLSNALHSTKSGSIDLGYSIRGDKLLVYVKDTGSGIAEKDRDKVFDRFEKIDYCSLGSGLGLTICKMLVESVGGEIGFDSLENVGSTFWARIPLDGKIDTGNQQEIAETQLSPKHTNHSKPLILVAEDNDSNYLLVEAYLRDLYDVERACDGVKAISMARTGRFDLIVMDMKMPLLDGLTATRTIREFNEKIPIIAATAYAFDNDRNETGEAGCNGHLAKPLIRKELLDMIANLLYNANIDNKTKRKEDKGKKSAD